MLTDFEKFAKIFLVKYNYLPIDNELIQKATKSDFFLTKLDKQEEYIVKNYNRKSESELLEYLQVEKVEFREQLRKICIKLKFTIQHILRHERNIELGKNSDISVLNMSPRVTRALYRNNVMTVGSLSMLDEESLLNMRNIGVSSIEEIKSCLQKFNLTIRETRSSF